MTKIKNENNLKQMLDEAIVKENEWPYRIPEHWLWVKIGQVTNVVGGGTPKTNINEYYEGGTISWLTPADLSNYREVYIGRGKRNITELGLLKSSAKLMPKGSVLLSSRAPVGYVAIASNEISTNQDFKSFEVSDAIHSEYAYWNLKYAKDLIESMASGTTFKEISGKKAGQIPFPLPPKEEQKRIAIKLSSMLAKLKDARDLIQEAKDSFESRRASILKKAFTGELTKKWRYENPISSDPSLKTSLKTIPYNIPDQWKWVFLKDVSDKFQYGTSAKSEIEGEVPVIRMGNIQHGKIDWNDLKFASDKTEIEKYNLNFSDVLFNRTNSPELVGKTAIYKGEMQAIFAGYLIKITAQRYLNPDYLNYFLNSPYAKHTCLKVKTDGVNQSNINATKLGNFEIPIPHKIEQQVIVKILDEILGKEITIDELIDLEEHFDLLEKSILSKAFRGELYTNDPKDEPAIKLLGKALQSKKLTPTKTKTRKFRAKAAVETKTSDISISIIKLSENAQRLLKEIKQYFVANHFNPDKLKDKSELSYEELKEALFELIKEPLEGKSKAKLKMNWDKGYLIQLSE